MYRDPQAALKARWHAARTRYDDLAVQVDEGLDAVAALNAQLESRELPPGPEPDIELFSVEDPVPDAPMAALVETAGTLKAEAARLQMNVARLGQLIELLMLRLEGQRGVAMPLRRPPRRVPMKAVVTEFLGGVSWVARGLVFFPFPLATPFYSDPGTALRIDRFDSPMQSDVTGELQVRGYRFGHVARLTPAVGVLTFLLVASLLQWTVGRDLALSHLIS